MFEELKGFADLCIHEKVFMQNTSKLLNKLLKDNVRTIAINHEFNFTKTKEPDVGKRGSLKNVIPKPTMITIPNEFKNDFVILNRLTVKFSTIHEGQILCKKEIRKQGYHIVAAIPLTDVAFRLCIASDIDIISLDMSSTITWSHLLIRHYKILVTKCIYFELPYSPLVYCQNSRINIIKIAFELLNNYKGVKKNIIVSSGMLALEKHRSPHDVISLCAMLGLNEFKAREAIIKNPKDLVRLAVNRMHGKSVLRVVVKSAPMPEFRNLPKRKMVLWKKK